MKTYADTVIATRIILISESVLMTLESNSALKRKQRVNILFSDEDEWDVFVVMGCMHLLSFTVSIMKV